MNQGISVEPTTTMTTPSAHALRLLLIFLGAVLGFLVLSFTFGSSSASADDGGSSPDSLGSVVGGLTTAVEDAVPAAAPVTAAVTQTVQNVTHAAPAAAVVAPVAEVADEAVTAVVGTSVVGDALGTTPVGSLLDPVVDLVDDGLAGVGDALAPVLGMIRPAVEMGAIGVESGDEVGAAVSTTAAVFASGVAGGMLDLAHKAPLAGDTGASGLAAGSAPLLAALAASGFLMLLVLHRRTTTSGTMPGSPVYETDCSPD